MNLQMQLRRGLIALIIGLVVCGAALGRAGAVDAVGARGAKAADAVMGVVRHDADCDASLLIDLASRVRLTVPCDFACTPLRGVLHTLHVPATRQVRCGMVHTA